MDNNPLALNKSSPVEESQSITQVQQFLLQRSNGQPSASALVSSWNRFYQHYSVLVRKIATRNLTSKADRDDCVQFVWQKLVQALPRLTFNSDRGTLTGWLSVVIHRLVWKFRQKIYSKQTEITLSSTASVKQIFVRISGPQEKMQQREKVDRVQKMLKKLSKDLSSTSYQVFHMRWIEERSYEDISNQLNLTPDQARLRNHRAKQKAKEFLTKQST